MTCLTEVLSAYATLCCKDPDRAV